MAEEKKQIQIQIRDKVATLMNDVRLVGGNNDYEVVFDFDEQWDKYPAKTAVFVFGNEPVKKAFDGNVCEGVVIENATAVAIGVFAGDLITSKGACVPCELSIRDMGGVPRDPTPNEYDALMELLNAYLAQSTLPKGGKKHQVLAKASDEDGDYEWRNDEKADLTHLNQQIIEVNAKVNPLVEKDENTAWYAEIDNPKPIPTEYLPPMPTPTVDQTYNPESENAQSGKAVAEAIDMEIGDIETAIDAIIEQQKTIIAIQNELIGGAT